MAQKKKAASKKSPAPDTSTAAPASSGKKLIYGDPNVTQAEWAVIQAVREFEVAEHALKLHEEQHKAVFDEYRELIEERNNLREAADKMVRGLDVSCGDWDRYQASVKWDPNALYQAIGRDAFLAIGGGIGTELVYSIDKERAELAMKTGHIPPAAVEVARKVTPSYHAPKPRS